jgi:signal transduction histidine kinase
VDNKTQVLFVSGSPADATILKQLLRSEAGQDLEVAEVTSVPAFYRTLAAETPFSTVVVDERVDWLTWRAVADECLRVCPDAVLILLVDAGRVHAHEECLPQQVAVIYPRNSAGLIALATLLSRTALQRQQFSLLRDAPAIAPDDAAALDEERQKLVYAVSHDLQDPLQLAKRYADILDEDFQQTLGETGAKVLGHLQYNLGRTQEMLDELLEYSRLQRAMPQREPVDFNELLDEVVSLYKLTLDEIGGTVTRQQQLPTLHVDRRQFQRVLQNLIGNAIKFRSERPLEISVRAQSLRGEWRIGIKDNGIGVGEDDAERIFDMFERGAQADESSGTGMGLAICRRIVQNHGGRLWVKSASGDGSVFVFSVPDRTDPPGQAPS